jgi:hypothetical protein
MLPFTWQLAKYAMNDLTDVQSQLARVLIRAADYAGQPTVMTNALSL